MVAGDGISIEVGYKIYVHSKRNYKVVFEILCGLQPEGTNLRECPKILLAS